MIQSQATNWDDRDISELFPDDDHWLATALRVRELTTLGAAWEFYATAPSESTFLEPLACVIARYLDSHPDVPDPRDVHGEACTGNPLHAILSHARLCVAHYERLLMQADVSLEALRQSRERLGEKLEAAREIYDQVGARLSALLATSEKRITGGGDTRVSPIDGVIEGGCHG